jgi:hypothetical protein
MASTRMPSFISMMYRFVLLSLCAVSMVGCGFSWIASRDTNPVIQDYTTPAVIYPTSVNIFATTASRRLAIIKENKAKDSFVTCAEPSPDVGEVFAAAIAAGLKASATVTPVSGGSGTGELATEFGRAVATQIAPLLYRTQGLQLYRDSIYKLCIDKMNGWITDQKEYENERNERFKQAIELIKMELPIMEKSAEAFYANVKAGNAQVNVNDLVKILDAQKK